MFFGSMEEVLVLILPLDADAAWESTGDGSVLEDQDRAGVGMRNCSAYSCACCDADMISTTNHGNYA